jgi:hypothetical protein
VKELSKLCGYISLKAILDFKCSDVYPEIKGEKVV